ncbi:argininosuccinate lyase [Defluviimonas sp. SAOS-178_SWC]
MRILVSLLCLGVLASCGADGAPNPPSEPGLTVSGTVKVGVAGSL